MPGGLYWRSIHKDFQTDLSCRIHAIVTAEESIMLLVALACACLTVER